MHTVSRRIASLAIAALLALVLAGSAAGQGATISSIDPASGPTAGGTTVVITGTYLLSAAPPIVRIGGAEATNVSEEFIDRGPGAKVTVTTPPGTAGAADVVVISRTSKVELVRVTGGFTYVAPAPTITATAVSPTSGLTTGGEVVTITGTGFSGATAPTVTFTGADGTTADGTAVTVASDTRLTVTTPPLAKGKAGISVTQGGATAALAGAYTYNQGYRVTVTNVWPKKGELSSWGGSVRALVTANSGPTFLGDWATTTGPKVVRDEFVTDTITEYKDYRGGMNCGERSSNTSFYDVGRNERTEEIWAGGPCTLNVPADYSLTLVATAGANVKRSSGSFLVQTLDTWTIFPFVSGWSGNCTPFFATCAIRNIREDASVRATWARYEVRASPFKPTTTNLTWSLDGGLTYYDAIWEATSLSPDGAFILVVVLPPTKEASHAAAGNAAAGTVVCTAPARRARNRLAARCRTTPALAAALKRGTVRLRAEWRLRLPNQRSWRVIESGRIVLRNRAGTTRVTG